MDDEKYIDGIELGEINKTYTEQEVKEELLKFCRECYDNKEKSLNKIVDNFNKKLNRVSKKEQHLYVLFLIYPKTQK